MNSLSKNDDASLRKHLPSKMSLYYLEYVHWYSFNFQRTVMIIVSYHVFFSKALIIFYALKCKQFSFFSGNLTFLVKNCKIFFSVYAHIYIVLKISACSIEFII